MPQMMPMNWINMFILINMIIMLVTILMYFNSNQTPIYQTSHKINNSYKWMW